MKEYMPQEDQMIVIDDPVDDFGPAPKGPQHRKKHDKHGKRGEDEVFEMPRDANEDFDEELTEEEKEDRRRERRRFNKIFRYGLIIGTAAIAIILFKFCRAKRMRNRNRAQQMYSNEHQQAYIQQQPQPIFINPNAYPAQPVQMGRPYPQPQPQAQSEPQIRGRVHDSFIRPQVVENPVEAEIRFHEAELRRLRNMKKHRQEFELQRVPINTTESFETHHPMQRVRNIPVGQPIYPKDANSSFASEYPDL